MQSNLNPQFVQILKSPAKDFVELFEFYSSDEEVFEPQNAIKRYSTTETTWKGFPYKRHVLQRSPIKRFLSRETNTVTVSFSTNSEEMVRFITSYRVEGMWLQIRRFSRSFPDESVVIFGGRCDKPDDQGGTIQVKQEIGGGDEQIPQKKLFPQCPLAFKGRACRGNQPTSSKSLAYQQAISCNRSFNQCFEYGNTENFQGFRFLRVAGTFSYQTVEAKRFLFFFTKKKKRTVSATWSSVSDLSEDAVIPEVAGTVQMELLPLMHADTGANLLTLQAAADGEIDGIFEVRQKDKKYLPILSDFQQALGKFGSEAQPASALFPGAGKFSGTAWVEFKLTGSDPEDANDESPTTVAIVRGRLMPLPDATGAFTERGWTDSGPIMTRFYLTELGRHPLSQIDDESFFQAFQDCNEPVIDDTGFEQAILPQQVTGGVDFKAFASASGFGAKTVDKIALMMAQGKTITGGYGQLVQAYYRYINQTQPQQFISAVRKVRRRYTTNFVLKEQTRLRDFIHDILLPSFNGYLIFNSAGKIKVKVDKAPLTTYVLSASAAGSTTIHVEDISAWRNLIGSQILIGSHLKTSEIRKVADYAFSAFGNSIPIVVASSGSLGIATSSATLTGAAGVAPAKALITLSGTPSAGATLGIEIDGIPISHTAEAGDDLEATAGLLAATINGHPVLKRYIKAIWNTAQGSIIEISCKAGVLTLDQPLANAHFDFEETIKIEAAFGGPGQLKILQDTFKWPLGSRQSSVNKVEGEFTSAVHDWAKIPIKRDYEEHQEITRKVNSEEINLSAVDNAHQAARLLKIYGGKRRICDWSCGFKSTGYASLFDVGDVIAVSHWTGFGEIVNVPVVIEEIIDSPNVVVELICRLFRSEIHDDRINELTSLFLMPLQDGTATNTSPDPGNNTGGTTDPGGSGAGGGYNGGEYPQNGGGYGTGGAGYPSY